MNTKEAKQSVQMDKALFDFYGSLPLDNHCHLRYSTYWL